MISSLLVALSGCLSLKPAGGDEHYYLLTGDSSLLASARGARPCVVRILPVEVPNYLQTRDMVVRTSSNEMIFATFHQWAEPLDAGVRRVLTEDLRTAPAIREVLTDEPPPANTNVYVISIQILACEGNQTNSQSSVLFKACWEISKSDRAVARGIFNAQPATWRPGDYNDLAIQLSRAVEDLGKLLNKTISSQD
ncbi:MAG TPA: PqiC family protein [Verrucomicrobiae bacterium]